VVERRPPEEISEVDIMTLTVLIEELRSKSTRSGEFSLLRGERINEVLAREKVPNEPGVYLIFSSDDLTRPIYIGRAGTMNRDLSWKEQGIRGLLNAKQKDQPRWSFFISEMERRFGNGLTFRWFVTHDRSTGIIPAFLEMDLLRAYFHQYKGLPELNECV
jgi:hypothetical protein